MPYLLLLRRLLAAVAGSQAALLLDAQGEVVVEAGATDDRQRLIGAFVATLGLPQINPVNEEIRLRMQALFGAGYTYTYLYPGLQKVVQAAGRVIRTPTDEGVVHLMDERFASAELRPLLPTWWQASSDPCSVDPVKT